MRSDRVHAKERSHSLPLPESMPDEPEQRAEFDSPWKEILTNYFEDFVAFFFPQAYSAIDWFQPYQFLDTELQQIVRDAELGKRIADKLAQVWLKNGDDLWVLVHIEIQNQPEPDFAKRMYTYNYRIFDRYNRQVASLAVLSDEQARWKPTQFGYELLGCEVSFKFPVVKLLDYQQNWQELEQSQNPFATVVMAHLKAQETRSQQQERKSWKLSLTRRLYERGYQRQQIIDLFRFIDWVMALPKELERDFRQEVNQDEEARRMRYVTSIERLGREDGIKEGVLRTLLRQLRRRFESVPEEVQTRLNEYEVEQLEELSDVVLTVESLDEFLETIGIQPSLQPDALPIEQQVALRMLRRLLQRRFESVPEELQTRLTAYSVEQLEELLDVALTVNSLTEFINSLPVSDASAAE